jgi:hypothetical protein
MTRRKQERRREGGGDLDVLARGRVLADYDASTLVGLRVVVHNAAIEHRDDDPPSCGAARSRPCAASST